MRVVSYHPYTAFGVLVHLLLGTCEIPLMSGGLDLNKATWVSVSLV